MKKILSILLLLFPLLFFGQTYVYGNTGVKMGSTRNTKYYNQYCNCDRNAKYGKIVLTKKQKKQVEKQDKEWKEQVERDLEKDKKDTIYVELQDNN